MGHDVVAHHARACRRFCDLVEQIGPDQWALPTPCPAWDVRALVEHVVRWNLAVPHQLDGATVEQLTAAIGADVLGDDPAAACRRSVDAAIDAFARPGGLDVLVHSPAGVLPGTQLALFRFDDNLIHSWDLARALGLPARLDADQVTACQELVEPTAQYLPATGLFAAPPQLPAGADAQARLLATHGRDPFA
ncbi:TIGR03086 family metal-binding protein [Dactylosporangium sp. NPDC049525]|uniref:TIGR03086 family metal-binding protein n=1 Tax=Dactylosporangium sp. NPDC049525 TaxID=3154730 RepID=UPI0034341AFF